MNPASHSLARSRREQNRLRYLVDQEIDFSGFFGCSAGLFRVSQFGDDRFAADLFLQALQILFCPAQSDNLRIEPVQHGADFLPDAFAGTGDQDTFLIEVEMEIIWEFYREPL